MQPLIEVDGVMRPALNSAGRRIHPTEEGVENFWRWFGNSKTTDEQGRPLVVYHGTANDFDAFSATAESVTGATDAPLGFWFGGQRRANMAAQDAAVYRNDRNDAQYEEGANVLAVYLRLQKPKVFRGELGDLEDSARQIDRARESGHDGVVWLKGERVAIGPVYLAFGVEQIKSATGNSGRFDRASASLSDQLPRCELILDVSGRRHASAVETLLEGRLTCNP